MPSSSIVTLLSDFGEGDIYVGVMKGVMAQINPQLTAVDLTHQIPPQNIAAASFCLMNAYPYFPQGTVYLAVVDPGVGSSRRAIAVQFSQGFLVGPDNGIFTGILTQSPPIAAIELTNTNYWRTPKPSKTFHGRDIFAPVAAQLARGVPLPELGRAINPETLITINIDKCLPGANSILGSIQYIDNFGNLISNIPGDYVYGKSWYVLAAGITIPGCQTYNDVKTGEIAALVGSHGWVEIAVNSGNAKSQLHMIWGDSLQVLFLV